jgi:hypothetical protein
MTALLAAPRVVADWNLMTLTRDEARRFWFFLFFFKKKKKTAETFSSIHATLSFDTTRAGTLTSLVLW